MILARLNVEQLETMEDHTLGATCFAPMIRAYKDAESNGIDFAGSIFNKWSRGQMALFPFWTYYSHVKESEADFYWWSAYYMARRERWQGLMAGLRFFEDTVTLAVIEEMEAVLAARNHPRSLENFDVSFGEHVQDPALAGIVEGLYAKLLEALPDTIRVIGDYIRQRPSEFVQLL